MTATTTGEFRESLTSLDVEWTRTSTDEFPATLQSIVREPAVGAPLPIEGISLADAPVTLEPTPRELDTAETGVTAAELGIASYGSVVLTDTPPGTEPVSLFPRHHVAVLPESDIVAGMPEAFERLGPMLRADRESAIIATGPSATADMGALVRGAHGPETVHVVILTDR